MVSCDFKIFFYLRGAHPLYSWNTRFSNVNRGPAANTNWMHDTPIISDVEYKLRKLLIELGNADKVLGIQVNHCFITSMKVGLI